MMLRLHFFLEILWSFMDNIWCLIKMLLLILYILASNVKLLLLLWWDHGLMNIDQNMLMCCIYIYMFLKKMFLFVLTLVYFLLVLVLFDFKRDQLLKGLHVSLMFGGHIVVLNWIQLFLLFFMFQIVILELLGIFFFFYFF